MAWTILVLAAIGIVAYQTPARQIISVLILVVLIPWFALWLATTIRFVAARKRLGLRLAARDDIPKRRSGG
jgi:hypothetical protein